MQLLETFKIFKPMVNTRFEDFQEVALQLPCSHILLQTVAVQLFAIATSIVCNFCNFQTISKQLQTISKQFQTIANGVLSTLPGGFLMEQQLASTIPTCK